MRMMEKLEELYNDIHNCRVCPGMAREKEARLIGTVDISSDVFIVSQAPARNQSRRSGISFFQPNGNLGSTGRRLEEFLNRFGRTVFPAKETYTLKNFPVSKARRGLLPVYNTEIVQCYPGKKGRGDRPPSDAELEACLEKGFLEKEINLIKPRLVLLLGHVTRSAFYRYLLHEACPFRLSDHLNDILNRKQIPKHIIGNHETFILPIFHSSGVNPWFNNMAENNRLINLITESLKENQNEKGILPKEQIEKG
jgi:uracil-DNA glycosylase